MAERLARLHGRCILSINDMPEMRETFGDFTIDEVALQYGVQGGQPSARELIVSD